jgi:anti-anti-sigma factor
MMTLQQIQIEEVDEAAGTAVIVVDGELDYSIYTAFKKSVNDLVARGITHVKYDLSRLSYIQSLGLGIIMWSYVELDSRGGSVSIEGANDQIKKLFTAAQLDTLVEIL